MYFKVRTSKGKTGIINDKGDIVIPFVYDEDISLSGFINIEENGLLYVKKDNLYGIINLKNETYEKNNFCSDLVAGCDKWTCI